jgi:hypothetical protein
MVLWFIRRKYKNDLILFLHFCDYPPFEEDLDLHLNKLEFPSCKICLYQVWLKLASCFILKDSFQYTNAEIIPLLCSPPWPFGTIICTSLNLHYVRNLSRKYHDLFWLSGSQGKFFSMTLPNFCIYDYLPFEEDLALQLNNLEFPLPKDDLY